MSRCVVCPSCADADEPCSECSPLEEYANENAALKARVGELEARIATIADENGGPHPVQPAEDSLTCIEAQFHAHDKRREDDAARVRELERQQAGYQSDYDELAKLVPKAPASVVSRVVERVGELEGALRPFAKRLAGDVEDLNRARKALEGGK